MNLDRGGITRNVSAIFLAITFLAIYIIILVATPNTARGGNTTSTTQPLKGEKTSD